MMKYSERLKLNKACLNHAGKLLRRMPEREVKRLAVKLLAEKLRAEMRKGKP